MKKSNKDVPTEAILKEVLIENGKLKAEVDYWKEKCERQEKAIAKFKEWQEKVATHKCQYWLNEGVKLMNTPPNEKVLKALRTLVNRYNVFQGQLHTLEKSFKKYIDAIQQVKDEDIVEKTSRRHYELKC